MAFRRWSLEWQLPTLAGVFFLGIASALTLVAHFEVRRQAVALAGERVARLVEQLAGPTGLTQGRTRDRLSAAASAPAVIDLLRRPGVADTAAVRATLAGLATPTDNQVIVGVWDLSGDPVLITVAVGDTSRWVRQPPLVDSVTITPIRVIDDTTLVLSLVAPVRAGARLVGFVQRQQRLRPAPQTAQSVVTILGQGGVLLIGSRDGAWTDMGRRVEPPPAGAASTTEPTTYQREGRRRIGVGRQVTGTPLILWAELPQREALAPTRGFLARLGVVAVLLVLVTTVVAGIVGRNITRPLGELREAAEGLRSGDYSRRVALRGQAEIAEVAETFNAMAAETDRHIEALRASEERFRSLATATSQIVWWTDANGNVTEPLPTWQAFTGQSPDEIRTLGWTNALHSEDAPRVVREWRAAVAAHSSYEGEYRLRRSDGEFRWCVARAVPVAGRDGVLHEWVGTCSDVTEQRLAEEKLRRKEAELQQSQRLDAVGRLAGGIAHDFNNLLTAMIVPTELGSDRLPADHPVRQYLREIRETALRAGALTRQLLAFGGQQVLQPEVLDVNGVVTSAGRMLQRVISESITLELATAPHPVPVRADRTQLEQVIVNLAVNARDAMPEGGRLTIETGRAELTQEFCDRHQGVVPGHYVLLAVTDTGIGMDAETQAHLFEPFFTTKGPGGGTGLGLATVYGIVRQSGGHIWVYSEMGRGTTFKLYFPEAVGTPEVSRYPDITEAVPRGTATILLVEDEPSLLRLGEQVLSELGYAVLTASRGQAALALARAHTGPIDLLVSDVVMPGMNGLELWRELRQSRVSMPALFLSGWASDAVVRHGILEGQVPFLQKPFTAEQLGRKVHEALNQG